jgi:ubiquinone/menaquinone biosynthesis C-methylase UbiE
MASAAAFDLAAASYDSGFGRTAAARVFRHVFQECLLARFRAGARLVDLGCGTGEDAVFLAASGYSVLGVDSSPRMIEAARAKAGRAGLAPPALRFEVARAEDVAGEFDGAYSNFGALNCCDLPAVGRALARALRPGSPVVLSVMAEASLPKQARRLWKGGSREPRADGIRRVGGGLLSAS